MPLFKPTWMINTIYNISPEQLKKQGINAVLTDLDNTLIPWNNPNATEGLNKWLDAANKAKIQVIVVSNNNQERVQKALGKLQLPYISAAHKPLPSGILNALKDYHLNKDEVVMVGDQLFTDVLSANLTGVRSILVKPLVKTDKWNTSIARFFEKFIACYLKHKYSKLTWKDNIDGK